MNLQNYIQERLKSKKVLLMTHAIVGYPSLEANWQMLEVMQQVGVDLVELQMPFSEPIADGPLFLKANQDALKNGIRVKDYFDFMLKACDTFDFPIMMMGYYNTAFNLGHQAFCQRLQQAGACGFILPDLPMEEFGDLWEHAAQSDLSPIMLCAPTNSPERLKTLTAKGQGFIYCVARKGVTGTKTELGEDVKAFIGQCRKTSEVPLGLGFGLSEKAEIQSLQGLVEIGIVGSALLKTWEQGGVEAYREHLQTLLSGCVES